MFEKKITTTTSTTTTATKKQRKNTTAYRANSFPSQVIYKNLSTF